MTRSRQLVLLCLLPAVACGSNDAVQKSDGSFRIAHQADAHWQSDVAHTETERALERHKDLAAVFAHDDEMALAAAMACKQKGRTGIKVLGVGGLPGRGLDYVADGRLDATIQDMPNAAIVIDLALLACSGIVVHRQIGLGARLYTKQNLTAGGQAQVAPGDFYVAMLRSQHAEVLTTTPVIDIVFRFGMVACPKDDPRGTYMEEELAAAAKRYPQVQLDVRPAGDNLEQRRSALHYLLEQNYNAILVSARESASFAAICKEAVAQGIKVLVVGGQPNAELDDEGYSCSIGCEDTAIGRAAAETIKTLVPKGGSVVEIQGTMTSSAAQQRHEGFAEALGQRR
ncbi:MAG: substrate-binding domain-containing protein [Planctomycetota bacterium]